jgi:hypothetical protein
VDIVIDLLPEEALKALKALQAIGYSPRLPVTHQTVDIFANYPLDFESLWHDSVPIQLRAASPRIAAIDHLIVMKEQAGRPQDLVDICMLKKLKLLIAERDGQ